MSTTEDRKEPTEELSGQDFERLKLLTKATYLLADTDNEKRGIPSLYRLEIKKVLEEHGNDEPAARIKT